MESARFYPTPAPSDLPVSCAPGTGCHTTLNTVMEPWVAIVDWDNWHGGSVDALIRQATTSGVQTVLFKLESLLAACRPQISDVDVLAHLGALAEHMDDGHAGPLAVNLSFGRLVDGADPESGGCAPDTLACQLSLLVDHLQRPRPSAPEGPVFLAAAGNHRDYLFPAHLQQVVEVGSLDLTRLRATEEITSSWETPEFPVLPWALMPASFCVELGDPDQPIESVLPTGASFATAFFTAWLTDAMLVDRQRVLDQLTLGPHWTPKRDSFDGVFQLAHNGTFFPTRSENAAQMLADALHKDPARCTDGEGKFLFARLVEVTDSPFAHLSVLEWTASEHRPAPEPDPCVPCALCCQAPSQGNLTARQAWRSNKASTTSQTLELDIDLSGSWELASGMGLKGLFLRTGGELRRLDLAQPLLDLIAQGNVANLKILGTFTSFDAREQPSLISLLSWTEDEDGQPRLVWDSTPLLLRP